MSKKKRATPFAMAAEKSRGVVWDQITADPEYRRLQGAAHAAYVRARDAETFTKQTGLRADEADKRHRAHKAALQRMFSFEREAFRKAGLPH